MTTRLSPFSTLILLWLVATACGRGQPCAPAIATPAPSGRDDGAPLPSSEIETDLPDAVQQTLLRPFTGDFDAILERRLLRVGVTFDRTLYFVDKGVSRGIVSEYARRMEEQINAKRPRAAKVQVFLIP